MKFCARIFKGFYSSGFLLLAFSLLALNSFAQQIIKPASTTNRPATPVTTRPVNRVDTGRRSSNSALPNTVEYGGDEDIVDNVTGKRYLIGNARVKFQDFELSAAYIEHDSKTNTIFARGVTNAPNGRYTGRPIFRMQGQAPASADSIRYNTVTKKGNVFNPYAEQEGGFFSGGVSKKQPDDEVHLKNVIYSTCNLPYPHTHFGIHISRGIASKNQIVTGPVYLEVEQVPLPLGLPFAFFPKPNKRSSGIIFPRFGEDATRGFFAQDFGYYLGLNDYWDATVMGTYYTRGSWEARLLSSYTKRYRYNGNINFSVAKNIFGIQGDPSYSVNKDFKLNWNHTQNANAHPGTTFAASVDLGTSGYLRNTAAGNTGDVRAIATNTLRSSISYGKVFGDGKYNLTLSLDHSQDTRTDQMQVTLPNLSFNVATFSPFDSPKRVGDKNIFQRITVGYSTQLSNSAVLPTKQVFQAGVLNKFRNGMVHNIPVSTNFTALRFLNFTLSANYRDVWYLQTTRRVVNVDARNVQTTVTDTVNGFRRAGDYNISGGFSTKLYSTASFGANSKFRALRHVATPSFSFSYNPDFRSLSKNYMLPLTYGTNLYNPTLNGTPVPDYNNRPSAYSIFDGGIYGGPSNGKSAAINFFMDNTVEAKIYSKNDTTGTGVRKIAIIQGLSLGASYNFIAPTHKLSLSPVTGRSQLTKKLNIVYGFTFNPYALRTDTAGGLPRVVETDDYVFKSGKLPRLTGFNLSFDYSFNSAASKVRGDNLDALNKQASAMAPTASQAEALQRISRDPNAFVDFNIPWNFAFSYSFRYDNPGTTAKTITNTLNFNGDVNLTPKWKVQFTSGFDFKAKDLSATSFSIYRDLHCWDLSAHWIPFGLYQSYSVELRVKASVLQDLKLSKRKGFYTRY